MSETRSERKARKREKKERRERKKEKKVRPQAQGSLLAMLEARRCYCSDR